MADKSMIYIMIASEIDIRADTIMKTHKLLWKILFAKQKSGASDVFCDLDH